jgi:hypothetical protein
MRGFLIKKFRESKLESKATKNKGLEVFIS